MNHEAMPGMLDKRLRNSGAVISHAMSDAARTGDASKACAASPASGECADRAYLDAVANRVHDQPLQLVSAARLCIYQLKNSPQGDEAEALIERADHLLAQSQVELRRLMQDAQPSGCLATSLEQALSDTAFELQSTYGIICERQRASDAPHIAIREIEVVVRMVRECTINAYKHAHVRRVKIDLEIEKNRLRLIVSNTPMQDLRESWPDVSGGFGLAALRRTVHAMGGTLELRVSDSHLVATECELLLPLSGAAGRLKDGGSA
jgi:signal transduction histidine kinase